MEELKETLQCILKTLEQIEKELQSKNLTIIRNSNCNTDDLIVKNDQTVKVDGTIC